MFFIIRKGYPLLSGKPTEYFKLFLLSATVALVIGIVVRFIVGEQILLHLGFSANLSNWMFGGSIPIYHGIDGANVRRFQGIFDGPNPAAFFLLMYSGVLAYYFRSAKKYYFLLSLWSIVLLVLLVYTYSRSALIGFVVGIGVFLVLHARSLFQKHLKTLIILGSVLVLILGFMVVKKEGTLDRIILREGSSQGHFERSLIGLQRAVAKPL